MENPVGNFILIIAISVVIYGVIIFLDEIFKR